MKYKCEACKYETTSESAFDKHNATQLHLLKSATSSTPKTKPVSKQKIKTHSCTLCDRQFANQDGLIIHYDECATKIINDKNRKIMQQAEQIDFLKKLSTSNAKAAQSLISTFYDLIENRKRIDKENGVVYDTGF
jgi:hypothetical protein